MMCSSNSSFPPPSASRADIFKKGSTAQQESFNATSSKESSSNLYESLNQTVENISADIFEKVSTDQKESFNATSSKESSSNLDVEMAAFKVFKTDPEQEIENEKLPKDALQQIFSLNLCANFKPVCQFWKEAADEIDSQAYNQISDLISPESLSWLEKYLEIQDLQPSEKLHKLLEDQQKRFSWLIFYYPPISTLKEKNAAHFATIEKWMSNFSLIQMCVTSVFPELQTKAQAVREKIKERGFYDLTKDVTALRVLLDQKLSLFQTLALSTSIDKQLNYQCIQMTEIPEVVGAMTNLRSLLIKNNYIRMLPASLSDLSNLEDLRLINNELKEIPEWVFQLPNLKRLYLGRNKIKRLPDCIAPDQALSHFNISDNKITKLPPEFFKLQVVTLNIAGNPLEEIPSEIFSMPKLKRLIISQEQKQLLPSHTNTNIQINISNQTVNP